MLISCFLNTFFAACVNDSLLFDASSVKLCLVTMTTEDHRIEDKRIFIVADTKGVFLVMTIIAFDPVNAITA